MDSPGNVSATGYWPLGSVGQVSVFNLNNFEVGNFQADNSGSFLLLPARRSTPLYLWHA